MWLLLFLFLLVDVSDPAIEVDDLKTKIYEVHSKYSSNKKNTYHNESGKTITIY